MKAINTIRFKYATINLIFYALLLVATPFIMLQNYLQGFIRELSSATVTVGRQEILLIPVLLFLVAGVTGVIFRRSLSRKVFMVVAIVVSLLLLGQWISDYYIDYKIYDLQNNWHYGAYAFFSFIVYSRFKQKNYSVHRIYWLVFGISAGISFFDELFQHRMSQRIFDLSDVAKDMWGVFLGVILIHFLVENESLKSFFSEIRKEKWKDYFRNASPVLFLTGVFSFSFLTVSSMLTEKRYGWGVGLISLLLAVLFFLLFHSWKGKTRNVLRGILVFLLLAQVVSFGINYKKDFIFHNNFLTIYKGIPLPFFDVIFYPDQTFRLADKKAMFNKTDKERLMQYEPDILLIGSGENGEGGNGFPWKEKSHFIYNKHNDRIVQVMIHDSRTACIQYNRLMREGYRVLFVMHKNY